MDKLKHSNLEVQASIRFCPVNFLFRLHGLQI